MDSLHDKLVEVIATEFDNIVRHYLTDDNAIDQFNDACNNTASQTADIIHKQINEIFQ